MTDAVEVKATAKKKTTTTGKVAKLVKPKKKPNPAAKQVVKKAQPSPEEQIAGAIDKMIDVLKNEGDIGNTELDQIADLGNGEVEGKPVVEESTAPVVLEVPNETKNLLITCKPYCFRCSALISTNEKYSKELKANKNCHYLNGNTECPARYNRLILGVPVEETAQELFEATMSNNLEKDMEIRRKLLKFDPIMQSKVLEIYRSKVAAAQ
jgi:hypothetical protein